MTLSIVLAHHVLRVKERFTKNDSPASIHGDIWMFRNLYSVMLFNLKGEPRETAFACITNFEEAGSVNDTGEMSSKVDLWPYYRFMLAFDSTE
jgi:hypothetical protein